MVNLLYSNPLPTPQFASLSILVQLDIPNNNSNDSNSNNHNDNNLIRNISSDEIIALTNDNVQVSTTFIQLDNDERKEVPLYPKGLMVNYFQQSSSSAIESQETTTTASTNTIVATATPATILDVHYDDNLEPYYTIKIHESGVEKQTDNAHIGLIDPADGTTTTATATDGSSSRHHQHQKEGKETSSEEADNINPTTPPLRHAVLRETITVITPYTLLSESSHQECMEELHCTLMESYGLRDDFLNVGPTNTADDDEEDDLKNGVSKDTSDEKEDDNDADSSMTPLMMGNNSKVRFGNGTKEGSSTIVLGSGDEETKGGKNVNNVFGNLPVKIYKPRHCLLGMTCYYLAVSVKDISNLIESDDDDNNDDDDPVKALFQHCASVLIPGILSPTSTKAQHGQQRGGVIVLTVGSTGPPYDLYGASTVIATLPQRLREGMTQLSLVDTNPKESLLTNAEVQRQAQLQVQWPEKDGSRRFPSFLGKSVTSRSFQQQQQQQQQLLQQLTNQLASTATKYDSAYFHRLYRALLATILDDEDGYMREQDDVVIKSYPFTPSSPPPPVVGTPKTPSLLGSLTDPSSGSGIGKKNRFTFSRRKVKNDQDYAFGDDGGGEGIPDFNNDDEEGTKSTNTADIIRREAQKLEVLSIAEEDMPIPRYSRLVGEHSKKSPSPRGRKSPRKGLGAAASSGRFGRPAVPSDLSGFEYRPSVQQQRMVGGGGGMSVSGFTTTTSEVSEDASIMTGDHTAYTTSSQSSVPTLSRSKRDDSSTSSSSGRSRRFMFMKKKKENSPKRKKGMPLSAIPQGQELQQQTVYDPFGNDDDEVNARVSIAETGVSRSPNTSLNTSTQSIPVDLDDTPPESPQIAIVNDLNKSYSYESEGKESEASAPDSYASPAPESYAVSAPESTAEPEPEPEPEPTRHLDVSLALNEDLTCEYKQSKLSTLTVEGTIQVRMSLSYEGEPPQEAPSSIPFNLSFKDHSGHVRTLQENKKFVENVSHQREAANREFNYTITIPREEEYFPVVRYKCDTSLRPVPIRVQSRVRTQGKLCRVALQISSNPQNPSDLVHLTIIMGVPPGLNGESLKCNPPGGVWNQSKRVVLWCVSELGGGEKFQLQAIFEMSDDLLQSGVDPAERLEFPVMSRCQCVGGQLSDVELDVSDVDIFPAAVSKNLIRRFRVSHKEKK